MKLNMIKCDRCLKIFDADVTQMVTKEIGHDNTRVYDLCPVCTKEFDDLISSVLNTWISGGQVSTSTVIGDTAKVVSETTKVEEPKSIFKEIVETVKSKSSEEKCYSRRCDLNDFNRCKTCTYKVNCPAKNDSRCNEQVKSEENKEPITKDHGGDHWTWTDKELDFLYKNKDKSSSELAIALGRSVASVASKRTKLGLSERKVKPVRVKPAVRTNTPWTDEEVKFLRDNAKSMTCQELADSLGTHTVEVTRTKLNELGIVYKKCHIGEVKNTKIVYEKWQEDYLKDNYGLMSQKRLAEAIGVSGSTVNRKLKEMKEAGIIK